MEMPKLPSLKYDDFYKYTSSFMLIIIIICGYALQLFLVKILENLSINWINLIYLLFIALFISLLAIAGKYFRWALSKWYERQKDLDMILKEQVRGLELKNKEQALKFDDE